MPHSRSPLLEFGSKLLKNRDKISLPVECSSLGKDIPFLIMLKKRKLLTKDPSILILKPLLVYIKEIELIITKMLQLITIIMKNSRTMLMKLNNSDHLLDNIQLAT